MSVSSAGASRSKSVQHTRAGASSSSGNSNSHGHDSSKSDGHGNGNGSRAGAGKSDQSRRPISNDFRGERERDRDRDRERDRDRDRNGDDCGSHIKEQLSKPQPKTAFGGSILSAPRNMFSKVSKESVGPVSVGTKGTSTSAGASIKKTFLGLAFGGRASSVSKERKGKGEQEGVGVGGKEKKAAAAAAALRGPIATPYDSDDAYMSSRGGSRRGSDPKRYGVRTGGSSQDSTGSAGMELNGQSEYLRMDKVGQDVMSEDQLERLLVQAKSVRSTSARHTVR